MSRISAPLSHDPFGPERLTPELRIADPGLAWWAGQAVLRLRREVAWSRRTGEDERDPAQMSLDLLRHREARADFFAHDVAARFLSDRLGRAPASGGRFARLADRAGLEPAECFVLALALLPMIDGALGPVVALLEGDAGRSAPSLALAQRLWDEPLDILAAADPARPLRRFGLIDAPTLAAPMAAAPALARLLAADPAPEALGLRPLPRGTGASAAIARRFAQAPDGLEIVVLTGPAAADAPGLAACLAAERTVFASALTDPAALSGHVLLAWVLEGDLVTEAPLATRDAAQALAQALGAAEGLGLRLFLHLTARDHAAALPPALLGPVVPIPPQSEAVRAARLATAFPHLARHAARIARDFRLETGETARLVLALAGNGLDAEELATATRAECSVDFHGLAEPLVPRYGRADIVLPPAIARQFDEAIAAIAGAPRLRHDWDGARRLGEGGIPLLFAGVPGTGKTMGAEVIARETGLPLFRIDLSQVVNKYIGETEKNLARVFDAAEKVRCILFFDEADALFGKRTEVRDANDRFANVETGYLLQRMDSFTGVSVLATNRRKDLDEAFTRRLRYVIEFPVPGAEERLAIWQSVFPAAIDASDLDTAFLARQFQITGGHIRSIAMNAALQAAARGETPSVRMADVLIATRRELDKLSRKSGADAFGRYWHEIEELRA
ncbi:AAA family ATPase [Rhodovulum euryhalinum]|uniref:ATPase family protein associated with various cellular activities (AAA) n=1 Tax=Rhodovulum euryhalinum TaxID=35805 RepID=A0A4R2KHX7_9RHOB|nr:ATP-binding protein [Rhodovulum euryhalinum]TCO70116.1 ATPase family protein associated with various cellular activities (AAA) [Rhodovulum euryhalinum]